MRLNKFLANSGLGSRRECDRLIQADGVLISGVLEKNPAYQIDDDGVVEYKGVTYELLSELDVIILNKPLDFLTSLTDTHGRKTIYDILPSKYRNYKYAGRLDYNSTGLILLVNKSDYAEQITNPKHKVEKQYHVICHFPITDEDIKELEGGVELDDGVVTQPAKINRVDKFSVKVIISEGKKRQVRRMFQAIENRVDVLNRDSIGVIQLGDLPNGQYRSLSKSELSSLFSL